MTLNLIPIEIKPGLVEDDTKFKVRQTGMTAMDKVRPHRDGAETIGGWEFLDTEQLTGKCRGIHCWNDNDGQVHFAFGTHSKLYVWTGGKLFDITPADFTAGNEDGLGGGGYGVGGYGSGTYGGGTTATDYPGFYPLTWSFGNYGEWLVANPRGGKIYIWQLDTTALATIMADRTSIYDADFTSYADQTAFDVDYTRGTGWTFDAADDEADCDGTQAADSDLEYTATGLTVGQRYRVTITFDSRTAGAISALGNTTEGTESSEESGTVAVVFIAAATSHTVAARADADWIGSVTDVTVEQMGAPEIVDSILVTPSRQIVAYGCEEELGVTKNPRCIRWCEIQGITDWTTKATNNAGEWILRNAGRIVRAKEVGASIGVWTDEGMFWQDYQGLPNQTWSFVRVGVNCGLIGPNAVTVLNAVAYWVSTNYTFYWCALGSTPINLNSPIDGEFEDNKVHAQGEKIYAGCVSQYGEVWFFYPDNRDGTENSRFYALSTQGRAPKWFAGVMDRTAWLDAGPYDYPVGVDDDGRLFIHERGTSAAGDGIDWSFETGEFYFDNSGRHFMIREVRPDVHNQGGVIYMTVITKEYPQGDETTHGPYSITSSLDALDFRASGAIGRLKFYSNLPDAVARMGRPVFDITSRGRR